MSTVTPLLNLVKPATVEQFSLSTYNNNLDAIDASAVSLNKTAKGLIAQYYNAATSGNFNTTEGLVDYVQVNIVKDRWYRVDFRSNVVSAGVNQILQMNIKKDTNIAATTTFATGGTISVLSSLDRGQTPNSSTLPGSVYASVAFQANSTETCLIKVTGNLTAGSTNFQWVSRGIYIYDEGQQI